MSLSGGFRTASRLAIWPLIVVGALNIENQATKAGYGDIWSHGLEGSTFLFEAYAVLTSDTSAHIILFLSGACIFAWVSRILERLDAQSQRWSLYWLAMGVESIAGCFEKNGLSRRMMNLPKELSKFNAQLGRFGLPSVEFDPEDEERNRTFGRYLRAIQKPLQQGDLLYAQELGAAALKIARAQQEVPIDAGEGTEAAPN